MDSAGYLVNHIARLFADGLRRRVEPLGIVPGQFPALLELWIEDGQTQKQLVEKLDIEQATLAYTLGRMERDGLITREEHPDDRRSRIVYLTDTAKAIRDDAYAAAHETNTIAMSTLSKSEQKQFVDFMQRIIKVMRD
ncbi:MarR family transcriptional regulator [Pyruvatibacter sp.]|uniref:MarR family winged helix-turn-helix transcriptional regulator n=1 Tax=Pyruvatibacter sp. TaxID=1981328 RepID=UPI0032653CB8